MDVPECNVCHVELDEDEHQPRHLGCSHDACLTCIKALIIDGQLMCPMCRTVMRAYSPDDFQINHGVVQVLRLFKGLKMQMGENKSTGEGTTANTRDICGIHEQIVNKRCLTCNVWICINCKDIHTEDIGCDSVEYNAFLGKVKKEHKEKVDKTILSMKSNLKAISTDVSDLESKRKEIDELIEKLKCSKEEGTKTLHKFIAASSKVDKATTSMELDKSLQTSNEWHKFTKIWCKKFKRPSSNLIEEIKSNEETYATLEINGKSCRSKLTFEDGHMYQHCFRIFANITTPKSYKALPFEQVQKWLPSVHDQVFLDLAISGSVQGRVTIRIRQDLPSYAKNMPLLFTGEEGEDRTLLGLCMTGSQYNLGFLVGPSTKSMNTKFAREPKAGYNVVQGSVLADWSGNNLNFLYIYHEDGGSQPYGSTYEVFGVVESGLDIVKLCRKHSDQTQVTVTDCGIMFKEDALAKKLLPHLGSIFQ